MTASLPVLMALVLTRAGVLLCSRLVGGGVREDGAPAPPAAWGPAAGAAGALEPVRKLVTDSELHGVCSVG